MLRAVLPLLLATLLAAGLGAGATRFPAPTSPPSADAPPKDAPAKTEKLPSDHGKPADKIGDKPADKHGKGAGPATVSGVQPLPPIVGPLRAPSQIWVRFEGAVVFDEIDAVRAKALTAEIADDTLVYFSTLSLPEIEGAAGLKAVREDLIERARIRGDGKVRDLLIQTLVTQ